MPSGRIGREEMEEQRWGRRFSRSIASGQRPASLAAVREIWFGGSRMSEGEMC